MNKKTLGLLKIAYSKVMSVPPVEMASNKYKESKKTKRIRSYNAHLLSLYGAPGSTSPDQTGFTVVNADYKSANGYSAGFDVLGYRESLDTAEALNLTESLSQILSDDDIAVRLTITDVEGDEDERLLTERLKLYTLSPSRSYLFNLGDFTIAAIGIAIDSDSIEDEKLKLSPQAQANLSYACENADYTIIYALNKCGEDYERVLMKHLVNMGADYVFATDMTTIKAGVPVKRIDGRYVHTCPSTGRMFSSSSEDHDPAVVLRHKLIHAPDSDEMQLNRCFLPLECSFDENCTQTFRLLSFDSCRDNSKSLESYKSIVSGCNGYHHINKVMTIGDICRIIDAELPDELSYMENVSVGKVTTHWPDSEKGDVLFFNEPYRDVNDVIEKPLKVRMLVVEKALEKGVSFVFSHVPLSDRIPHVVLHSPMESHIKLCAYIRSQYPVKTVGITGSIGKTSTKDMLYDVLKQHFDTDRNLRNTNTQVNIGLHIQAFKEWQEIYIQEIGGGRKGGASRHSRMILPSAACVTNIGDAHIGNHGSREALMRNKLGIVDGLAPGGTLYLNGDDPLLSKAQVNVKVVYYAVENREADYYADNIRQVNNQMFFDICSSQSRTPVVLNVLGEHNVLNAVCCYAIARQFGMSDAEIQAGLAEFRTSGVRQNFVEVMGYRLFVDCFNASPDSIDSSLSVLDSLDAGSGKKIAVIGDVTGMAGMARDVHRRIGEIVLTHKMDILVCYGKNSREVYKAARAAGLNAYSFTKSADLISFLKKNMKPDDIVLFKGSSKMKLAQVIDRMFGTMFSEQMYADSAKSKAVSEGGIDYNVCPAFATVKGCSSVLPDINLGDKIKGRILQNIDSESFKDNLFVERITLGPNIRHIGDRAFAGCTNLKDIYLPDRLMYIGEDAFADCPELTIHCREDSQTFKLCRIKGIKTD